MFISVINHTKDIPDEEIHHALRAINRQIEFDFRPYWSLGATLRLEGKSGSRPNRETLSDMRGDAVLYLWDDVDVDDALGYHERNHRGIPFSFVFTRLAKELKESWTVTLSHEAIELIGDPEVNLLVQGPHPRTGHEVFHWYELCDAVQAESYKIDEVDVSNFVLPLYFTSTEERAGRNDFLGRPGAHGKTLESFKVKEGGYIGFFDPEKKDNDTFAMAGDKEAERRKEAKERLQKARRAGRHGRNRRVADAPTMRLERRM
ncbi:MAG: hypothetical protein LC796_00670 [Acidobacteria bacterium]|nr:hypothetical protein [Acidobacteriota bacterium]MCA1611678.1 hypothetical protein [Acidobacteriota bacterium]